MALGLARLSLSGKPGSQGVTFVLQSSPMAIGARGPFCQCADVQIGFLTRSTLTALTPMHAPQFPLRGQFGPAYEMIARVDRARKSGDKVGVFFRYIKTIEPIEVRKSIAFG